MRIVFAVYEFAELDRGKFGKILKRISAHNVALTVDFHVFQIDTSLECVFGDFGQGRRKNNLLYRGVVFEAVLVEVHHVFVAGNFTNFTAVVVVQRVIVNTVNVAYHHFDVLGRQRCAVCGNCDKRSTFA